MSAFYLLLERPDHIGSTSLTQSGKVLSIQFSVRTETILSGVAPTQRDPGVRQAALNRAKRLLKTENQKLLAFADPRSLGGTARS